MKIVLSALMAFSLLACTQNEKEATHESNATQVDKVEKQSQSIVKVQEKTQETTQEKVQEKTQKLVPEVPASQKDVTPQTQSLEKNVTQKLQATSKKVKEKEKVVASSIDGATLYKMCASCHGDSAQKQALNKSQVIKGWESSKTIAALKGYKDGTYGGPMKAIMKAQATKLSDKEIEALAHYISGL